MIAISRVDACQPRPSGVSFNIESPLAGSVHAGHWVEIAGWLAFEDGEPGYVEVQHRGLTLRRSAAGSSRPDVARALGGSGAHNFGFRMPIGGLALPEQFELVIQAVTNQGYRQQIARICGAIDCEARSAASPALRPLMVTMQGRVGSTRLMSLLGSHPSIAIAPTDGSDAYETRLASYWLHALNVLSEPADLADSSARSSVSLDPQRVGYNPFFGPPFTERQSVAGIFAGDILRRTISTCVANIDDVYLEFSRLEGKGDVRYFAEKFQANHIPWVAWNVYESPREVFLVRDFRDMFCSILAFNRKRGFESFGRERFSSDEEYLIAMGQSAADYVATYRLRRGKALLIRYEDLVSDPEATLRTIFEYLEIDNREQTVAAVLRGADAVDSSLVSHRTSLEVEGSVARWRRDLEPPLARLAAEVFGPSLEELGYPM